MKKITPHFVLRYFLIVHAEHKSVFYENKKSEEEKNTYESIRIRNCKEN